MNPRPITPEDVEAHPGSRMVTMTAPDGLEGEVATVDVIVDSEGITWVPFLPDELDVTTLAHGGTVWLGIWTERMPPVALGVRPKEPS